MTTDPQKSGRPTVQDIEGASVSSPLMSEMAAREKNQFDHQHRTQRLGLGAIGVLFGEKDQKPGNISAIVIVLSLFFIFGAFIWLQENIEVVVSTFSSLITLALGYLFGSRGKKD